MENKYRRYLIDTFLSLIFWVPVIGVWSLLVAKLDYSELLSVMAGTAAINASLGGLYGKLFLSFSILWTRILAISFLPLFLLFFFVKYEKAVIPY